jgi:hypothetical protein
MMDTDERDRDHPILPHAHTWEIVGLRLERDPQTGHEPFLDLTLRRGGEHVNLRFWSPQDLEIERGGPTNTGGLVIEDISARGWDRIGVRVTDREVTVGAVRFVARAVDRLS